MSCYIASNNNRFYAAVEPAFGAVPLIGADNRFPGVKLTVRQEVDKPARKDKTGTRTFQGLPSSLRRQTAFELRSYMTGWANQTEQPGYGPLFQAALGGDALLYSGGTAGTGCAGKILAFSAPHGLAAGQAVTFGGELRFVAAIADEQTVLLNAAFSIAPSEGSPIGATMTYLPATQLKSASIFDYWSPAEAVQRVLCGAGVDKMQLRVNGDYHEFRFSGAAMDVIDSRSFSDGQGALTAFPRGTGAAAVRLQHHTGAPGPGLAGIDRGPLLHDHGRGDHARQRAGHESAGVRSELAEMHGGGDTVRAAGCIALRQRGRRHDLAVPGGQAALPD